MGFKTNKCCCAPRPQYYTMRSHYANYFDPIWRNTCDGLPYDEPPPHAFEDEVNEFGYGLLTAGYVNGTGSPITGDVIITERDLNGVILRQSNPTDFPYATQHSGTSTLFLESSNSRAWVISGVHNFISDPANVGSANPRIRVFDLSTFTQISDFTLATGPSTMRAINNDIVALFRTGGTAGLASVIARKYNTVGTVLDTLTVADLAQSKTVVQFTPYVSRHYRRDYEKILVRLRFNDLTSRIVEVDLDTFGVVDEGPYFTLPGAFDLSIDHYSKDHFDPTNNTVFISRSDWFTRIDLDSLTIEYFTAFTEQTGGMTVPATLRVYDEKAYIVGTSTTPTAPYNMLVDTSDGSVIWYLGTDSGIGPAFRAPVTAHIFNDVVLAHDRAYELATGDETWQTVFANYAMGQEIVYATNDKSIADL